MYSIWLYFKKFCVLFCYNLIKANIFNIDCHSKNMYFILQDYNTKCLLYFILLWVHACMDNENDCRWKLKPVSFKTKLEMWVFTRRRQLFEWAKNEMHRFNNVCIEHVFAKFVCGGKTNSLLLPPILGKQPPGQMFMQEVLKNT